MRKLVIPPTHKERLSFANVAIAHNGHHYCLGVQGSERFRVYAILPDGSYQMILRSSVTSPCGKLRLYDYRGKTVAYIGHSSYLIEDRKAVKLTKKARLDFSYFLQGNCHNQSHSCVHATSKNHTVLWFFSRMQRIELCQILRDFVSANAAKECEKLDCESIILLNTESKSIKAFKLPEYAPYFRERQNLLGAAFDPQEQTFAVVSDYEVYIMDMEM